MKSESSRIYIDLHSDLSWCPSRGTVHNRSWRPRPKKASIEKTPVFHRNSTRRFLKHLTYPPVISHITMEKDHWNSGCFMIFPYFPGDFPELPLISRGTSAGVQPNPRPPHRSAPWAWSGYCWRSTPGAAAVARVRRLRSAHAESIASPGVSGTLGWRSTVKRGKKCAKMIWNDRKWWCSSMLMMMFSLNLFWILRSWRYEMMRGEWTQAPGSPASTHFLQR